MNPEALKIPFLCAWFAQRIPIMLCGLPGTTEVLFRPAIPQSRFDLAPPMFDPPLTPLSYVPEVLVPLVGCPITKQHRRHRPMVLLVTPVPLLCMLRTVRLTYMSRTGTLSRSTPQLTLPLNVHETLVCLLLSLNTVGLVVGHLIPAALLLVRWTSLRLVCPVVTLRVCLLCPSTKHLCSTLSDPLRLRAVPFTVFLPTFPLTVPKLKGTLSTLRPTLQLTPVFSEHESELKLERSFT